MQLTKTSADYKAHVGHVAERRAPNKALERGTSALPGRKANAAPTYDPFGRAASATQPVEPKLKVIARFPSPITQDPSNPRL